MHIDSIEIANFRKLRSTQVSFAQDKTVFVGANNSGKTSAMVALRYFLVAHERTNFALNDFTVSHWPSLVASKSIEFEIGDLIDEESNTFIIIAQRLCELTLFDSATSLERALSNNLRHGVVVPRFLKVFTDAISNQTASKPLSGQTNATWYEATFAQAGRRLFALEEELVALISEYQEE